MTRLWRMIVRALLFIVLFGSGANAQEPVTIRSYGWTIVADPDRGVFRIDRENLGVILQDVRLNLRDENRDGPEEENSRGENRTENALPLRTWSIEKVSQSMLTLHTVHPITAWTFQTAPNGLRISSTVTNAFLTARAPAPLTRIPVRALDPEGFPVDWRGTEEAMQAYGGVDTWNPSFLPRRNPEVLYLGLGLVSGRNFHELFDRPSDTIVQFSEQTILRRSADDETLMDITMPVPGNASIRLIPDYFTKVLGVPSYTPLEDSYFRTAPMVWSSWTGYYRNVTEDDIVQNTDWLEKNLKPYGLEYVQLDDGYDQGRKGEHYWIENWDQKKFSHGPQWLTSYIKSKGFHPGIWLVPNAYAGAVERRPEWYLYSKENGLVLDYQTPALDSSNPEVLNFLRKLFTTLDAWGFEYYKFDGEGSIPQAMPELDKRRLFDSSLDPVAVYRDRLKVIRDTIGPHRFLEICPAGMPLNGIGYINSYFNGNDVFNNWQGMYSIFSSINANIFFNHIVAYLTPGEALELGKPMTMEEAKGKRLAPVLSEIATRDDAAAGVGVTDAEARTLVTYTALTGVSYQVGNVMMDLPEARLKLLQHTMPTLPILPLDLFSRGTDSFDTKFLHVRSDYNIHNYPEILDLKVSEKWGNYDVAAFTNWRSETESKRISLTEKLGLDAGSGYIAFDFWNQKLLGVFSNQIPLAIEPHDTRVLLIHPVSNRPQMIANSRHISGTYSIVNETWDGSKRELSGTSETIAGEPYALWFYVPKGFALTGAKAEAGQASAIVVKAVATGDLLEVSFEGRPEPITWHLNFTGK